MTRTLIVGPIGARPWISMDELVDSLTAIGHEVIVNGEPDDVVPTLKPLPSRLGAFVNSAPSLVAWLLRMLLRWRRTARRSLIRSGVDQILVWDEVLALLCRMARPRGVEVVWIVGPPEGSRSYQRALRAAVARTVDRVVTSWHGEKRFADQHEAIVRMPVRRPKSDTALLDGWVVFGSEHELTDASLQRLRARAARQPAMALVFNARDHDRIMPGRMDALCEAAQPSAVWWSGGDEWITRLGGIPAEAIDPHDDLQLDHRHLRALGAGAVVHVAPANTRGLWDQLVTAKPDASGWKRLELVSGIEVFDDDHEWAARAFAVEPGR
ncbi:MAG TPA: hypothetical protein VMZ22_10300 [Acidimicrobiales bacterium]|nr:hypothetical protein [Acidimicrobiales bacterium]